MKIAVTMFRFVATSCLVAAACGQQFVNPKDAKILKEQRFNAGDGRHGAAFAQQDGTVFREESTADGERIGQYSYIDQDGNTITVRYTAGKDGFRILEGAHIPEGANGQNSAPFAAENSAPVAPVAPVQPAAPVIAQPAPQTIDYDYVDEPVDPNFNPFINPHDPTHRDFRFNTNGANFAPKTAPAPAQTNNFGVPDCANCAGVNPFVNPFDASHQQAGLLAGHQAGFRAPVQPAQPRPRPVQPQTFTLQTTTQAAPRFFPPGNLQLNRFETGFNFDFASQ